MKFILLPFVLLLCVVTLTTAQQFPEFAPIGAKWTYNYSYASSPMPGASMITKPVYLRCTGRDTFTGVVYKRLEGDLGCSTFFKKAYLRQDGAKIYFYNPKNDNDYLLYDFEAKVGDTWQIQELPGYPQTMDIIKVTVTDITTRITEDNDTLKVWKINKTQISGSKSYWEWSDEIIERVGNHSFLFPGNPLCEKIIGGLRCYEDPTFSTRFVPYPCNAILDNEELGDAKTNFSISPNPTTGILQLQSAEPFSTLYLYDHQGRNVATYTEEGMNEIDISNYPNGFYVLKGVDSRNHFYIQKVIKF